MAEEKVEDRTTDQAEAPTATAEQAEQTPSAPEAQDNAAPASPPPQPPPAQSSNPKVQAETGAPTDAQPETPAWPDLDGMLTDKAANTIDMLKDVELNVKIELGRAEMSIEDILKLSNGSVVELDKLAGDPVDVLVNEQLIARGEVLVLNDNFCIRINEIIPGVTEKMTQI